MSLTISPSVEQLVQQQLATGRYKSEEEVLIAALKRLKVDQEMIADLEEAMADEAAGRLRDFEEIDAEFRQRYGLNAPS